MKEKTNTYDKNIYIYYEKENVMKWLVTFPLEDVWSPIDWMSIF